MQMGVKIVQAGIDDASEILELQKIAYQKEAVLYDDWNIPPLIQTLSEIQYEMRKKIFLKAIRNERIIGSVRAYLNADSCIIGRLIVHPECQGKGIGTLLMQKIEGQFVNARRFELFTGAKSVDNIRLYQKLGYAEYRQENLPSKVRLVFMEKLK